MIGTAATLLVAHMLDHAFVILTHTLNVGMAWHLCYGLILEGRQEKTLQR